MPARYEPLAGYTRWDRLGFLSVSVLFLAVAGFLAVMVWRTNPDVAPVAPVAAAPVMVTIPPLPTYPVVPVDANGVVVAVLATVTPTPLLPTPTMVPYVWPTATVIPDTLIDVEVR